MKTIYALLEPDTRRIRYVGATGDPVQRLRVHWSSRLTDKKAPVVQWIKTLAQKPELHILQEVSDEVAHDAEEYWIKLLRQVPTVDLVNAVDTWTGSKKGRVVSDETRRKLREARRGKSSPRINDDRLLEKRLSPQDFEDIRQSTDRQHVIAERYGISHMSVSRIKRGIR